MLISLGVDHEFDRQTDGQTDGQTKVTACSADWPISIKSTRADCWLSDVLNAQRVCYAIQSK